MGSKCFVMFHLVFACMFVLFVVLFCAPRCWCCGWCFLRVCRSAYVSLFLFCFSFASLPSAAFAGSALLAKPEETKQRPTKYHTSRYTRANKTKQIHYHKTMEYKTSHRTPSKEEEKEEVILNALANFCIAPNG